MVEARQGNPLGPIPPQLDRWNWGAFLLNWIWGIGNNTYIALLTLIPLVGFVMPFVLGARGNAWAWQNGRWRDVEQFRRTQRLWGIWGAVIWLAWIVLIFALVGGVFWVLWNSEAYKLGVAELRSNSEVAAALGSPISTGFPSGKLNVKDGSGEASLSFSAKGPKGSGTAELEASKVGGVWSIQSLTLKVDGREAPIVIIGKTSARLDMQMGPSRRCTGLATRRPRSYLAAA